MPSLLRATIALQQRQWEWHRRNPGQLSRMAQAAVDQRVAIEALPEAAIDRAAEEAAQAFWDRRPLEGRYAICNDRVIRHLATEEQMAADARALGVPAEQLLPLLDGLYDLELECSIRRQALLHARR